MKYRVIISFLMLLIMIFLVSQVASWLISNTSNENISKQKYLYEQESKQILVINSYHGDMPWIKNLEGGIKATLDSYPEVTLNFDYMDTKRNIGKDYLDELYKLYTYKYAHKKFDAIIATDDVAYQFILQYQQQLFPETPIVFCGINFYFFHFLVCRKGA